MSCQAGLDNKALAIRTMAFQRRDGSYRNDGKALSETSLRRPRGFPLSLYASTTSISRLYPLQGHTTWWCHPCHRVDQGIDQQPQVYMDQTTHAITMQHDADTKTLKKLVSLQYIVESSMPWTSFPFLHRTTTTGHVPSLDLIGQATHSTRLHLSQIL